MFVNNRRLAERLALRLNDLAEEEIARSHHGSLSREARTEIEEELKSGRLKCLVATSSLELGIDMGAVDLVVQIESPKSVARGLQRVGRAGHTLSQVSKGRMFPKFRADLVECAVVTKLMRERAIEETAIPRSPLDVLAQQVVAMVAIEDWTRGRPARVVTSALPVPGPVGTQLENVLDMLDGRYPSEEFAELRPRLVWDRIEGTLRARRGSQKLAVTNAGHDPRPRPVRGAPARRPPRRRARRGDGLRGARGPGLPARLDDLAHRGDHARPRDRHARARGPRRDPLLEGRRHRPHRSSSGAAVGAFQREITEMPEQRALELLRERLRPRRVRGRQRLPLLNEQREATRACRRTGRS